MCIKEITNLSKTSLASSETKFDRLNYKTHPQTSYTSRQIDTQKIIAILNG
ncbi:4103_t:CDS:1, partial [Cetraspora pellucida]